MNTKQSPAVAALLLLLALLLFTFFYKLSLQPVYVWDEARRANDSLQMLLRGDWIIDFYDDDPTTRSSKSPLLLWLQVVSLYLFGINEWALRAPSAAASVLIGCSIWWFCYKYFKSAAIGLLAGAVFASTLAWVIYHAGRTGDYDALLTLFTTLYGCCFFAYCVSQNNKWLKWFWVLLTLAVLTKGVAGLFFVPGLALFALTEKRFKSLLQNKWFYRGAAFLVVLVSGYYFFREIHAPGFLSAMYNNELGGRYLTEMEENGRSVLFYIKNFFWRFRFWVYLAVPAFAMGVASSSPRFKKITVFNFILIASFIAIISFSKTKLFWYDLPIYPFLAIQVGCFLYTCFQLLMPFLKRFLPVRPAAMAVVFFILVFFFPFRTIYKYNTGTNPAADGREQALYLKQALIDGKELRNITFLYQGYDHHIRYYIKRMQLNNKTVGLENDVDSIMPQQRVVISQPEVKQELEKEYELLKEEAMYGCETFYIKKRKADNDKQVQANAYKNVSL